MKFGPVAVSEAAGALLAHTIPLPGGALEKGRRLTADDLEQLREAGVGRVLVAQLEAGDIHEDAAAARLADAMVGDGVRSAPAQNGRCDLFAEVRGMWVAPRPRIDAINCLDEAIAIAALPSHRLVEAGELVATVKIIPFSVPEDPLNAALSEASMARVRVAPLQPKRAGLLLTTYDTTPEDRLERASENQRTRLRGLGCELAEVARCAHTIGEVTDALKSLVEAGVDPILIVGASSTVDRRDVIPTALEDAGGIVAHLGMPVVPGSMIMIGRLEGADVIGVPGCGRDLAPSGYDQILNRVVAGLAVDPETIMRMGSGGLLISEGRSGDGR
jgi:molybdenum cofactor cytidylyltransferase